MLTESARFEKFLITGIIDPPYVSRRKPISPDRKPIKNYQDVPINYMKTHTRLMIVHGTGAGKTKTSAHIIDDYLKGNKIALVFAPGSVMDQFRRGILSVTGVNRRVFFISYELMGMLFDPVKKPEFIRLIQPWLSRMLVVCDEIHTANDKKDKKMYKPLFDIFSKAHKVVIMTATPVKNTLKDLVVYMKLLGIPIPASESNYASSFGSKVSVYNKPPRQNAYTVGRGNFPNLNMSQKNVVVKLLNQNRNRILNSKVKTYSELRTVEREVFKNRINPKFEAFWSIYQKRPFRSIVYFEEKQSVSDFVYFVKTVMPNAKIETITSDTTKARKTAAMKDMSIDIYAITSAGKVGLDFKAINNVVFMEYPWTSSDYMQIVGRAVRTSSHNAATHKDVKVYNLMYRAPSSNRRKFKNEIQLNKIEQKRTMSNQVKNTLKRVSIESATYRRRPNTPSPVRAATPRVAQRTNRSNTFKLSPTTNYSTAAPRSIIRGGTRYSPSNWRRIKGVPPTKPPTPPKSKQRNPITPRSATPRNAAKLRINAITRSVGQS